MRIRPASCGLKADLLPQQQEVTRAAGASAKGAVARARPVTRRDRRLARSALRRSFRSTYRAMAADKARGAAHTSRSADLPFPPTERDLSCLEVVDLELLHVGRGRKSLVAKALKSRRKPVRHERVERLA
jgi:hypothetical protein